MDTKKQDDITFGIKIPRSIGISVVIGFVLQLVYLGYMAADVKHVMEENSKQIVRMEQSIGALRGEMMSRTEATLRMDTTNKQIDSLSSRIKELEARVREAEKK